MPPYASIQENTQLVTFDDDINNDGDHDLSLVDISLASKTIDVTTTNNHDDAISTFSDGMCTFGPPCIGHHCVGEETKKNKAEETSDGGGGRGAAVVVKTPQPLKPSILDRLLDCNPCTMKIANPRSALFKIRVCSECGNRVHRFRNGGYKKELQLLEKKTSAAAAPAPAPAPDNDDEEEQGDSSAVVVVVVETKVYFHTDCFQKHHDRIVHKDTGGFASVLEELVGFVEARTRKKEEERAAAALAIAAALAEQRVSSPPGVTTPKDEEKKTGFLRRTKQALKLLSRGSCRGKKDCAADESAFRGAEI